MSAPSAAPLRVREATRSFGATRAVDAVDLELHPGELLVLVGPSGCGKSTLLRAIAGLVPLEAGAIEVAGTVVDDGRRAAAPERRPVGMVFQDHALFPHLTIEGNVGFGLGRQPAAARRARVAELLELVGIAHLGARYPHEVSGGERQRASVARAVAPQPELLLLDEPFAALDPNLREQVRRDLVALLRTTGTPAVFVSHDQAEALALGDRLAVMRAGRLVQVGSGPELYDRPIDRFVAGFLGDASFLPIERGAPDRTELGVVEVDDAAPAGPIDAVIRPADVAVDLDPTGLGEVVGVAYQGPTWAYDVRLGSGAIVRTTAPRHQALAVGDRVGLALRSPAVAVVPAEVG